MPVCKSCGAPFQWVETANKKLMPVDPDGVTSHFATCPDRVAWRKRNGGDPFPPGWDQPPLWPPEE
jgi:hypothetical protein